MGNKEIKLSEEQITIVKLFHGQHLVLAPPGTGKTELLAQRVNYALNRGVKADQMICLTFTNHGAKGMKERIEEKYPISNVFIGNIHHFSSDFLFRNRLIPQSTSLLDEEDTELLLKEAIAIEQYKYVNPVVLLRLNSQLKLQKLNFPKEILYPEKPVPEIDLAKKVCERYESLKEESSLIDFDDLLTLTYYYLTTYKYYNFTKYSWIQVDEVQDLNAIQWEIIKLISADDAHIVFFGDNEQAIFSFMGARLEKLHAIERECQVHNLQKNFRSPSYLLQVYVDYAKTHLNPNWKKDPIPVKVVSADKNALLIADITGTNIQEAEYVIDELLPHLTIEDGKQTAILVRWNNTADLFSNKLKLRNIGHFKISGFDLFRRKLIKDIIAFLSYLENELDRVSWYRIFTIFGKIPTLRESRHFVNSLFNIGLHPADFLKNQSLTDFELENFINSFRNERIVIFDTETTGLNTRTDDIIQIAAVELINGNIGNTFEVFLRTDKDLGASENTHHISKQFLLKNGIHAREGLKKFYDFVDGDFLLAHNLDYDWKILVGNSLRNGIDPKIYKPKNKFDTLEFSRKIYPKLNSYKLAYLISHFNLPGVNTHNALDDVLATAHLTKHLANEAGKIIILQKEFAKENHKVLQIFERNFNPIWSKWKNQFYSETNFTSVIKDFLDYLTQKLHYSFDHEDEYHLSKLLRHMEITCGNKIFIDLLKKHMSDYKLFKESDLILGDEKIIISTVHKAKGLEFENVIVPECVEGVYPSWASKTREEYAEDARTLYVALSRAKKRLILTTHTISEKQFGRKFLRSTSRFINCIEKHFEKIST